MADTLSGASFTEQDVTDAYIYTLARFLVIRQEKIDLAEPGITYNVMKHNQPVAKAMAEGAPPTFVNPNLDTIYSEAWVGVDEHTPALLTVPEIPAGLYYTVQIVDEWADILYNVNERNFPQHPHGEFALCLAGSKADLPDGTLRLDLPSPKAKMLIRVQIAKDLDRAITLQHKFAIRSSGSPKIPPVVPIASFTNAALPGAEIFAQPILDQAFTAADECPKAGELQPLARKVGEYAAASDNQKSAVDKIIKTASLPALLHFMESFGFHANGWSSTAQYDNFGADYYFRTTANLAGIWWNSALEAVYIMANTAVDGTQLDAAKAYTLTFAADALPSSAEHCFWSLTMLAKPSFMLVDNPAHKYAVNGYSDLRFNADGSLTLYLASTKPADAPESNWLPTPTSGSFTATLRLYLPTTAVRKGEWKPGGLTMMS